MNKSYLGTLLTAALLLVSTLSCSPVRMTAATEAVEPVARIDGESWRGAHYGDTSSQVVFRGLPYAAPPVGELRWQAPTRRIPGPGEHAADSFGPACIQSTRMVNWMQRIVTNYGGDPASVEPLDNISEDCLYLNVWTPNLGGEATLPVMVWIYGGSNRWGWAHSPDYDGAALADRGAVVITINYRVGIIGFFAHPALTAEGTKGNQGILDQLAALEWVQRNAAAFGGDADNITIFGESAGAVNVSTLMASPLAKGKFKRAVVQSAGFWPARTLAQEEQTGVAIATVALKGIDDPASAEALTGLRAIDGQAVRNISSEVRGALGYAAILDDHLLPTNTLDAYADGAANDYTVMIGINEAEASLFMRAPGSPDDIFVPLPITEDIFEAKLMSSGRSTENAEQLREALADEKDIFKRMTRLATDDFMVCSSITAAEEIAGAGGAVRLYYFTRVREGAKTWIGANHTAEIGYVFDTAPAALPETEVDVALKNKMGQYWVNFATSGDPNGDGLPSWPAFDGPGGTYQDLGTTVQTGRDLEGPICAALPTPR